MPLNPLTENMDRISELVIPGLDSDLDVIQKLDDEPNDVGGLTAAELKAKFDEAGNLIKIYLNNTLLPALSDTVAEEEVRAAAEAQRVANEEGRVVAEQERDQAEAERTAQEDTRINNESTRNRYEVDRITSERSRKNAEIEREAAEQTRVTQEQARDQAETLRAGAERNRQVEEDLRIEREGIWIENENTRQTNETNRIQAEQTRVTQEQARDQAESDRQAAEQAREAAGSGIIAQATEQANASEAWAVGTRGGSAVPSNDPAYQNNAKYYAQQAVGAAGVATSKASESQTAAQNAAQSEANAQGAAEQAAQDAAAIAASAAQIETNKDNIEALQGAIETKAEIDGTYENMTVGNAEQLVSTIMTEDKAPYNFRTTGGAADVGNRAYDTLVGGTLVWNQMVPNGNFAEIGNWVAEYGTLTVADNVGKISDMEGWQMIEIKQQLQTPTVGRKYLLTATVTCTDYLQEIYIKYGGAYRDETSVAVIAPNTRIVWNTIINATDATDSNVQVGFIVDDLPAGNYVVIENVQVHDLTLMFGPAIADYVYSLEQATQGAGVAWFCRLFTKSYYAYNPGELMSVQAASHDAVGFNQFNKNNIASLLGYFGAEGTPIVYANGQRIVYIPCFPNTKYCASRKAVGTNERFQMGYTNVPPEVGVKVYGIAKVNTSQTIGNNMVLTTTTGPEAKYLVVWISFETAFNKAKDLLCINFSRSADRDGSFEAYKKDSYPLDATLTLRGIPKLDENNNLYYDGDIYGSDGTVTRHYEQRPYSSGDESLPDAVTDGTNTVVKIASSNIEATSPFQSPQIVDDFGTEEYVDAGVQAGTRDVAIPVGHVTKYPMDLRGELEKLLTSLQPPATDGSYILKVTVADGAATFAWEATT